VKILALVPARSGSKRLPQKNLLEFGETNLVGNTFHFLNKLNFLTNKLVSTDNAEILSSAQNLGILGPWLRPANLAEDSTDMVDVALHALDWYESNFERIDVLLLSQPTSPFRSKKLHEQAVNLFSDPNIDAVISTMEFRTNLTWLYEYEGDQFKSLEIKENPIDHAKNILLPTGNFFFIRTSALRLEKTFIPIKTKPIISPNPIQDIDIDTEQDYVNAKNILGLLGDFAIM